jgi:hypothetical protein
MVVWRTRSSLAASVRTLSSPARSAFPHWFLTWLVSFWWTAARPASATERPGPGGGTTRARQDAVPAWLHATTDPKRFRMIHSGNSARCSAPSGRRTIDCSATTSREPGKDREPGRRDARERASRATPTPSPGGSPHAPDADQSEASLLSENRDREEEPVMSFVRAASPTRAVRDAARRGEGNP